MADLNIIALSGNLTQDPELKHTSNGTALCKGRMANNGFGRDKPAMFIDVTCWGRDAEYMAKNCKRGTTIQVSGRLESNSYTDKNGNNRTSFSINVRDLYVIKRAPATDNYEEFADLSPSTSNKSGFSGVETLPEDGIPF